MSAKYKNFFIVFLSYGSTVFAKNQKYVILEMKRKKYRCFYVIVSKQGFKGFWLW